MHAAQSVSEPNDAQHHGQHFPCHCDGHKQHAGEMAQRVINEDLADGAAGGEAQDGLAYGGVALDEADCSEEFVSGGRREADEGSEGCCRYVRGKNHVGGCQESGEEVLSDHHLRP